MTTPRLSARWPPVPPRRHRSPPRQARSRGAARSRAKGRPFTPTLGVPIGHIYAANMRTAEALPTPADPLAERLRSAGQALISALQEAASLGLSCPAWLGFRLRLSAAAAHAQVHLARRLPAYPATQQAFTRGWLSARHAGMVVRVLEAIERASCPDRK